MKIFIYFSKEIAYIKYMKMKKANKKILEAVSEVAQEKEYQKLVEAAKPHFKDEWDAVCFELDHPTPEFIRLGKELKKAISNVDFSKIETINCKL